MLPGRKKKRPPTPRWFKIWGGIFVAFILYNALWAKPKEPSPPPPSEQTTPVTAPDPAAPDGETAKPTEASPEATVESEKAKRGNAPDLKKYPTLDRLTTIDVWKKAINPHYDWQLDLVRDEPGTGDTASCGMEVVLNAEAQKEDGQPVEGFAQEYRFTIGEGREVLKRSVVGMQVGGQRQVKAGKAFFADEKIDGSVMVGMELLSLSPKRAASEPEIQMTGLAQGLSYKPPAICGEDIHFHLKLWDAAGKQIYDSRERAKEGLTMRLGKGELAVGFDMALAGMMQGEVIKITIPPSYLVRGKDAKPSKLISAIPLNRAHIALAEVERIAYTDPASLGTEAKPTEPKAEKPQEEAPADVKVEEKKE